MFTSIQQILLETFDAHAGRPAIRWGDTWLTYKTLKTNALKIAGQLGEKYKFRTCVGILCKDPSLHITAIIGAVLSGNHYISLTQEMMNQDLIWEGLTPSCILYENDEPQFPGERINISRLIHLQKIPCEAQLPEGKEDDRLCAFLTSGSTGDPRLVVHSVKNILQDTFRQIKDNHITHEDVVDQVFSFSFSASLATIFPALLSGASLAPYLFERNNLMHIKAFWIKYGVSFSSLTVSYFRLVSQLHESFTDCTRLRFISIGAEPVFPEDIDRFLCKCKPGTELQVAYASTETRTSSEYRISRDSYDQSKLSTIGKPVSGKEILIFSEQGERLPPYQTGEIVVASAYIAKEYLHNPEETAKAFSQEKDRVLYRTGDNGFLDGGGYLHYCGRKDHEIKMHGKKVDINTIETAIKRFKGVRDAAVIIDCSIQKFPVLTAYICTENKDCFVELTGHLRKSLPSHPLPGNYVAMDQLPVTHTGKIDRKKLQQEAATQRNRHQNQMPTIGKKSQYEDLTGKLVRTWQVFFNNSAIHSQTDFFTELGGDSILAVQLVLEMQKTLRIKIPTHALISFKTPARIARNIEGGRGQEWVMIKRFKQMQDTDRSIIVLGNWIDPPGFFPLIADVCANEKINISYVYLDILGSHCSGLHTADLIEKAQKLMKSEKGIILVGFSFMGYLAYQISAISSNVSDVFLLDTPNYFEYEPYLNKNAAHLLKCAGQIIRKSGGLSFFYHQTRVRTRAYVRSAVKKQQQWEALTTAAVNKAIGEASHKRTAAKGYFFKSNTFWRNPDHGANWADYFSNGYQLVDVECSHEEIIQPEYFHGIQRYLATCIKDGR